LTPRSGRRPAGSDTADQILAAARAAFAAAGYEATSLRGIARSAGVDPALVVHYFHSKDRLFATVMKLPDGLFDNAVTLISGGTADVGDGVARLFLSAWEDPASREPLLAIVRSAVSHEQAAATLRGFVTDALLGRLGSAIAVADQSLRITLAGSQLVGVAMLRYVVRVEPLASADVGTLVAWLAPALQRYLTGASPSSIELPR
jgi:AcrR family transcriptional regulator